jgi:hypothetical protein
MLFGKAGKAKALPEKAKAKNNRRPEVNQGGGHKERRAFHSHNSSPPTTPGQASPRKSTPGRISISNE